jgi:hypothetical protein
MRAILDKQGAKKASIREAITLACPNSAMAWPYNRLYYKLTTSSTGGLHV